MSDDPLLSFNRAALEYHQEKVNAHISQQMRNEIQQFHDVLRIRIEALSKIVDNLTTSQHMDNHRIQDMQAIIDGLRTERN